MMRYYYYHVSTFLSLILLPMQYYYSLMIMNDYGRRSWNGAHNTVVSLVSDSTIENTECVDC